MPSHYGTVEDANAYFSTKLHESNWTLSQATDRPKALIAATQLIDALKFYGVKTSDTQSLEFPRNGETQVPEKIVWACYEVAYALLGGFDPNAEAEGRHVSRESYAGVAISYFNRSKPGETPLHILNNIPSIVAWGWLQSYMTSESQGYSAFRIDRVS